MALRAPHPSLRPFVRQYVGWFEHMAEPLCRRELPTDEVPVIVNFGARIRIYDAGDSDQFADRDSFATGAYDSYVRVVSSGPSGGVQINFSILGARLFLNQPLDALRNRSVPLDELLGPYARRLTSALQASADWDARFAILDREIGARLRAAGALPPQVSWAWRRIIETRGRIDIGRLVDEVGWSQRHLITRFRSDIGLSPKTMARVMRFGQAARLLRRPDRPELAAIAADCGYYDQSHFTRDFRAFAGVTPGELVSSILPDNGGIVAS
jgi:AraC-like DNA-binding protein